MRYLKRLILAVLIYMAVYLPFIAVLQALTGADLTAAFSVGGIAADCEIRVPAALAGEWKGATNWATYADKIVGV